MTVLGESESVDHTAHNRCVLERQLGIDPGTTRFVSQIHSTTVLEAGPNGWTEDATIGEGDAIISPDGTDPIAILVADCLPVAFTTDYGPTAIAHAGRVGLLGGILEKTVYQLRSYDDHQTGKIHAVIGPGICGACYEVPEAMRDEAAASYPVIASTTSWETPALDLPKAAAAILRAAGVDVTSVGECTYTNELLYSHRRQPGVGRLAGFVWKP